MWAAHARRRIATMIRDMESEKWARCPRQSLLPEGVDATEADFVAPGRYSFRFCLSVGLSEVESGQILKPPSAFGHVCPTSLVDIARILDRCAHAQ